MSPDKLRCAPRVSAAPCSLFAHSFTKERKSSSLFSSACARFCRYRGGALFKSHSSFSLTISAVEQGSVCTWLNPFTRDERPGAPVVESNDASNDTSKQPQPRPIAGVAQMQPADHARDNYRENEPGSERESALALAPDSPDGSAAPWRLGFWSLVVTQFQGAFNDNALKFLVIYLVVDMGLSAQHARLARAARRRALCPSLHPLFHDRRLPRRPLQQALGDHRHQMDGGGGDDLSPPRARPQQPGARIGRRLPAQLAGRAVRTIEVRPAPRDPSRKRAFLGQRHHRTRHVSRFHRRHGCRRLSGLLFPRPAALVRRRFCWRAPCSVWPQALAISRVPAANPARQVQSESAGRPVCADSADSRRPHPGLGVCRQCVPLVSGRSAAIHDRHLRPRHPAHRRSPYQLLAGGGGHRHRHSAAWSPDISRKARSSTG